MTPHVIALRYNLDALVDELKELVALNDDGRLDALVKKKMLELRYTASLLDRYGTPDPSLRAEFV